MKLKKTVFVIITDVQKSVHLAFVINQQLSFSNCVTTNKINTEQRKVDSFMKASSKNLRVYLLVRLIALNLRFCDRNSRALKLTFSSDTDNVSKYTVYQNLETVPMLSK